MKKQFVFRGNNGNPFCEETALSKVTEVLKDKEISGNVNVNGNQVVINGNENTANIGMTVVPDYKSLQVAIEEELADLGDILRKAQKYSHAKEFVERVTSILLLIFIVFIVIAGLIMQNFPFIFSKIEDFTVEIFITLILVIAAFRLFSGDPLKDYVLFLHNNLYQLKTIEQNLRDLYKIVCNNYADTLLAKELRSALKQIAALKADYAKLAPKYLRVSVPCMENER